MEALHLKRKLDRFDRKSVPEDLAVSPHRLLTVLEAAGYMAVSSNTINQWIAEGRLPYIPIGKGEKRKRYRLMLSDLDAYILQQSALYENPSSREKKLTWTQVAALLDLNLFNVHRALKEGKLKDLTEPSVREYIIKQVRRTQGAELRRNVNQDMRTLLGEKRKTISLLRKQLGISDCPGCNRPIHNGRCVEERVNFHRNRKPKE